VDSNINADLPTEEQQPPKNDNFFNKNWFIPVDSKDESKIASVNMPFPVDTFANTSVFKEFLRSVTDENMNIKLPDGIDQQFKALIPGISLLYGTAFLENMVNNQSLPKHNAMRYGGKDLIHGPTPMATNKTNKDSNINVMRFLSVAKQTDIIDIPLPHSGFWVTLQAPTLTTIVAFQNRISAELIRAGKDTNTIAFNNLGATVNTAIVDLICSHIRSYTLICPDGDDVRNYISGNDYYSLVLGLLMSQYPKGTIITRYCKNNIVLDSDGRPKCNFSITGRVDLSAMMVRDDSQFTDSMLLTLSKRNPNSVSIEEVLEYQSKLAGKMTATKEITIYDGSAAGTVLTLELAIPNIMNMCVNGVRWINKISKIAEEIFTSADNNVTKENKVRDIIGTVVAGIYNTVIAKMSLTDENGKVVTLTTRSAIDNALDELSRDNVITDEVIDVCYDFINASYITAIGFPIFECPSCKELNDNAAKEGGHPEIIPFNIVDYFFALSSLNATLLAGRMG